MRSEDFQGPPLAAQELTSTTGELGLVLVFYCDPQQTPPRPSGLVTGRHPCLAVQLPEVHRTVAVNFADTEQTAESPAGPIAVGPRSVRVIP